MKAVPSLVTVALSVLSLSLASTVASTVALAQQVEIPSERISAYIEAVHLAGVEDLRCSGVFQREGYFNYQNLRDSLDKATRGSVEADPSLQPTLVLVSESDYWRYVFTYYSDFERKNVYKFTVDSYQFEAVEHGNLYRPDIRQEWVKVAQATCGHDPQPPAPVCQSKKKCK